MATKQDLLDRLEAAGVTGFSLDDRKAVLEAAVSELGDPHPNRDRYEDRSNRAHSVRGD